MDQIVFESELAILVIKIRIGHVAGQGRIVVTDRGAEQDRLGAIESQGKLRQVTGIAVVDPRWIAWAGQRVATLVEYREHIIMFERPERALLQ